MTAEELRRVNYPEKRTELVRGRVVREPAGYRHGRGVGRITPHRAVSRCIEVRIGYKTGSGEWDRLDDHR